MKNQVLNPEILVGLEKEEAIEIIELNSLLFRVTQVDGNPLAVTSDYRTDRINLQLENGYVASANIG